jgi:SAM-dependent methyltransferase
VCPSCGSGDVEEHWRCRTCGERPAALDGFLSFAPEVAAQGPGFDPSFFAELAALEAGNFWFRARNDLIAWAIGSYLPDCRHFLEIGCGTGFVLKRVRETIPTAALMGSEVFTAGLAFAAERNPEIAFAQIDARHIPFRDHFDAIGAFDVLEHIEDDIGVIAEVARALRAGGWFILTVPQHPALWSPQDEHAHHVRRYTARGLRTRLEANGFEIVRMTSFVALLLPFLLASRARMRTQTTDAAFDAMDALRLPAAANAVLGAVMRLERAAIERGVSWPAGGSLLVVARRIPGTISPS